jgi:hypothetical protein
MTAPDKIILPKDAGVMQFLLDDVVYLRKDALLEWAKDEIELSKKIECASEKSYEEGRQQVAQNLIDKIESL